MSTPQVIVTLSPNGDLTAELPGAYGTRRRVELRRGETEDTLLRILRAQLVGDVEIGLDGAPTQQQVKHWERHAETADPRCPFCIKRDPDISAGIASRQARERRVILAEHGGVVIRRVPARARGKKVIISTKSAEELGL